MDFLNDPTGSRRFLVIPVNHKIAKKDIKNLKDDYFEQMIAEIYYDYQNDPYHYVKEVTNRELFEKNTKLK